MWHGVANQSLFESQDKRVNVTNKFLVSSESISVHGLISILFPHTIISSAVAQYQKGTSDLAICLFASSCQHTALSTVEPSKCIISL